VTKKPTDIVPTMLRIREELRKRIEREAKKRDHSLNAEMVDRLERSFARDEKSRRDSAIIDMLVDHNHISSAVLRKIASELAKNPDWFRNKEDMKNMIEGMYFAAYGKEPDEAPRPGEEL
jgi:hypothetical protein